MFEEKILVVYRNNLPFHREIGEAKVHGNGDVEIFFHGYEFDPVEFVSYLEEKKYKMFYSDIECLKGLIEIHFNKEKMKYRNVINGLELE